MPKLWPKPGARSHATHFSNKTMSGSHRDSEGTRMAVIPPYSSGFQESLWSIHSCNKPAESSAHSYTTASFLLPPPASEGLHCTAQWAELGVRLLHCREDARQAWLGDVNHHKHCPSSHVWAPATHPFAGNLKAGTPREHLALTSLTTLPNPRRGSPEGKSHFRWVWHLFFLLRTSPQCFWLALTP